ncbi:Ig-like domain-containing protein [Epibacterium sp. SM1979]|uniref:Ig-like domain-containing protein n=1 Tax=Tritonibacter litoralis TaxID=2662264 RepID=A0A843YKI5_9RHOB|nr:Ig-like domain-containing protein [Tritonibacter litoralis]MQQ09772.1 Ig-like domain-containing protein [Tritonibacter litoralis]
MSTIAFITRDQAGTKQHGEFAEANSVLDATSAKDISLNLSTADVQGYSRVGNDLQILTMDGQILVLDNYFATGLTGEKNLFLSDNGEFIEVVIDASPEGALYPTYEPLDVSGKWSAYDELVFLELDRVEPVIAPLVAAPALGGLGAAAAAAGIVGAGALAAGGDDDEAGDGDGTGGGAGDGGDDTGDDDDTGDVGDDGGDGDGDDDGGDSSDDGDSGSVTPTVDNPDASYDVAGDTTDPVTISGTGAPGSTVDVTIGTATQTVTVNDDGIWSAPFDPADLPADGNYDVEVHVEDPDGETFDLDGPTLNIDTTPPPIAITEGTQSVGEIVNANEQADGPVISGEGEVGASISVEIDGTTHTTTVGEDGTWSVTFSETEIATGEYTTTVTVTSADAFGNTTVVTDVLEVDTIAPAIGVDTVEGDDLVNAAEAADGVTLSGTGEAGAAISVEFMGETATTTVGADGTWAVAYDAALIAGGEYDATATVTSTDAAGNSSTTSHTVEIDTVAPTATINTVEGDDVVNAAEAADGVTLSGTGEAGAAISVEFMGETATTTVGADGTWAVAYDAALIAGGEYDATATVTSTDAAGNSSTTSHTVEIDTVAPTTTINTVEGDDFVNAAEAADGVTLSGTGEAGAAISVEFMGEIATTTVGDDGSWSVAYDAAVITAGEYDTTFTVTSTDAAGNSSTSDHTVTIDTVAPTATIDTVETDDVVNAAEASDGVTLSGSGEAGSTVEVTFLGSTRTTTVAGDGSWSLDYDASDVPAGESSQTASVTLTDAAGNVGPTVTHTVEVDTLVDPLTSDALQTADDIINQSERAAGVTLTGTVEPGSSVTVTINSVTRSATVDASGNWTVDFDAADLPEGTYSETATITATDAAGNTASISETFAVDTYGASEYHGLETNSGDIEQLIFEDEITDMAVSTVADDGTVTAISGVSRTDTATDPFDPSIVTTETSFFLADPTQVPDGSRLVITGTDTSGNTADTLLILEDNVSGNVLDNAGLSGFNVEILALDESAAADIVITEDDIKALSSNTDTLVVHGGTDDTITVTGVTASETRTIDGESFNVYTVGTDGTTLIVEEDVNVII